MQRYSFSGHEKFYCRQMWLKKGYDFIKQGGTFSDGDAIVSLGVGKNMVRAIRYWLKSFGLIDEHYTIEAIADYLLGAKGKDQYIEDLGTIWLLHYYLVTTEKASIYSLLFNEFRKERVEFTKQHLLRFLKRKCEAEGIVISLKTLETDVTVFINNYLRPKRVKQYIEDEFSGLLFELELLQEIGKSGGETWYKIENTDRDDIPIEIILYTILNQTSGNSISFNKLLNETNSVGMIYAMNANGLMKKINEMTQRFSNIVFTDDAGVRELQFKERPDKQVILEYYYGN